MALNVLWATSFEEQLPNNALWDNYNGGFSGYVPGVYGGTAAQTRWSNYGQVYISSTSTSYTVSFWGKDSPSIVLHTPEGQIVLRIYSTQVTLSAPGIATQTASGLAIYNDWHYFVLEKNGNILRVLYDGNEILNTSGTTASTLAILQIGGYDNGPDLQEFDHVVLYEGPYIGYELYLRPIQPAADVSSSMDGREPATAASNAEVLNIPYNDTSYVYSTGTAVSKSAVMSTTMPALPSDIQEVSVQAVVVWGAVDENVATSSTAQIGLEKAGITYLSPAQTLQTAPRAFQYTLPQNPETNMDWASSAEVAAFNLVVQHNHA